MSKAVPDRLKPQECKKGSGQEKLPIPNIPKKDELQDAVDTTASTKLTLLIKVELQVSAWSHGTPEKFIFMHVQQSIAAIKAKGLQNNYEKLVCAKKEYTEKLKEAVLNSDFTEGEVMDNSPLAKAV